MKHPCPHCSQYTISNWQKLNSGKLFPAKCSNCGGSCRIPVRYFIGWVLVWLLMAGLSQLLIAYLGFAVITTAVFTVAAVGLFLLAKKAPLERL